MIQPVVERSRDGRLVWRGSLAYFSMYCVEPILRFGITRLGRRNARV